MTAWSCWTLPGLSRNSVFEFDSYTMMQKFFWDHHAAVRNEMLGAYIECDTCNIRGNGLCSGGCLAHPLRKMVSEQQGLRDLVMLQPIRIEEVADE